MAIGPLQLGALIHEIEFVAARGVEPLSEYNTTYASTGVVTVLMSPKYRPVTGYTLGHPDCLLQHTPGGDVTAYPTIG